MEEIEPHYSNRIKISEFGTIFLKQLPRQLNDKNELQEDQNQNFSMMNTNMKRRGQGINFQEFANHTQFLIKKEVKSIFRVKSQNCEVNQLKRKQILHHNNWINQQKLIKHKLSDTHLRIQQIKFSQYDWKKEIQSLKSQKQKILTHWQSSYFTREKRIKSKLKKMLQKKYPKRNESCYRSHFSIKDKK